MSASLSARFVLRGRPPHHGPVPLAGVIMDASPNAADSADIAWRALTVARDHDWSLGPVVVSEASQRLTLEVDGRWHATAPLGDDQATCLDALLPLVGPAPSLVVAQLGQSLDGRIATETGHSHYINGLASRVHLHRLRALVDAVVVGAGTVAADDPALTVRHVSGRSPLRVVIDPRGRLDAGCRILRDACAPTLQLIGDQASIATPARGHLRRERLPLEAGGMAPRAILERLAQLGCRRVLIEGGSDTVSRFLDAGALHRLHLLVAPLLIGSGRPGLCLAPIARLDEARRPRSRRYTLGDETLFDLDLRPPT
ncbi:RibD family protein [Halomonas sp. V046]|uniref:RibD family protein n=1 Tax=Halomonas sp. V046 TaxID=3459611 RepID=UPI004044BDD2